MTELRLIIYSLFFTVIAFLITSLANWSFFEALTFRYIVMYVLFFIVLFISFTFIEKRNEKSQSSN